MQKASQNWQKKGNLDENPLKNMKHEINTILQFNIKL